MKDRVADVVGLIVAVILFVVPSYGFVMILIRGYFEASGYRIDWKTSPLGMIITLLGFLFCPGVIVWALATGRLSQLLD